MRTNSSELLFGLARRGGVVKVGGGKRIVEETGKAGRENTVASSLLSANKESQFRNSNERLRTTVFLTSSLLFYTTASHAIALHFH